MKKVILPLVFFLASVSALAETLSNSQETKLITELVGVLKVYTEYKGAESEPVIPYEMPFESVESHLKIQAKKWLQQNHLAETDDRDRKIDRVVQDIIHSHFYFVPVKYEGGELGVGREQLRMIDYQKDFEKKSRISLLEDCKST